MKKKLLSLVFLAIVICLSVSLGMGVALASSSELSKSEISKAMYFTNVNKSIELYDKALSSYKSTTRMHSGDDVVTYSDDFGGVYIVTGT